MIEILRPAIAMLKYADLVLQLFRARHLSARAQSRLRRCAAGWCGDKLVEKCLGLWMCLSTSLGFSNVLAVHDPHLGGCFQAQ